jgi:hypothetical protein
MRARRLGCLTGCLTRFLLPLVLISAAGMVFIVATDYVFAPWSFYLGGQFHMVPGWQGIGTMHTDSGDYVLYVLMTPQPNGRGARLYLPYFRGSAYLCTPRGERFPLRLSAGLGEHPGKDTNGMTMSISMYWRPWNYTFTGEGRPRLSLRGRWQNPDLVMDDGGTLARAFLPDGTVYRGPARNQPRLGKPVPIVLHTVPWSRWWGDCRR